MDKEKAEAGKGLLVDSVINFLISSTSEAGKNVIAEQVLTEGLEIVSEATLDTGLGFIPGVGNAISSYRTNRKIRNIEMFGRELADKVEELQQAVSRMEESDKKKADDILDYAIVSVESYTQDQKIKYLANGIRAIFENTKISYDISYLYINTLNNLTILDIAVLKLYTNYLWINHDKTPEFESSTDVLEEFNIEYEQYQGIQSNLYRMGILETATDQLIEKDLTEIEKSIKSIRDDISKLQTFLGDLANPKKNTKRVPSLDSKPLKIKSKEQFKLSKFGYEFYQHFLLLKTEGEAQ